jgi:hypothetical protein
MLSYLVVTVLRALRLAGEQAENAVRIPHRRHFRIHNHHSPVGKVHRQMRTLLNPRGRIANDVVEAFGDELVEHPTHALRSERILVTRLGGSEHEKRFEPLVLDQRLLERALALDDVDEVIDHAALASHDEVEVAQPDIEIDDRDLLAAACKPAGQASRGRRLPDASLARSDNDDFGQWWSLLKLVDRPRGRLVYSSPMLATNLSIAKVGDPLYSPIFANFKSSPESHAWTGIPASSVGIVSNTRNTPAIDTSSA